MFAAVLEDEFFAAVGAFLFLVDNAIRDVFLQGASDAILPSVDVVLVDIEVLHQVDDILDGHAMT